MALVCDRTGRRDAGASMPTMISMTWPAVAAICGVMTLLGGWAVWSLRATIRLAVQDAVAEITKQMQSEYVSIPLCQERHCAMERRIEALEAKAR